MRSSLTTVLVVCSLLAGSAGLAQKKDKDTPKKEETKGKVLFQDKFETLDGEQWAVNLPPQHPDLAIGASAGIVGRGLRLENRPYVVSRKDFTKPAEYSFEWKWKWDENQSVGLEDRFQFLLRTTGKYKTWAHEPQDGLRVRISPASGEFEIHLIQKGKEKLLGRKVYEVNVGVTPAIPKDDYFAVRVRDDGKKISVYWDRDDGRLIVEATYDAKLLIGKKIAFSNREGGTNVPKQSFVRKFVVRELKPSKKKKE
jgi:hypothetical protein